MFKNYCLIAVRHLMQHRLFSLLNAFGLAIGLGCCLLVILYIHDEWRYDRHHVYSKRIYRVLRETDKPGEDPKALLGTSGSLASALVQDIPEVEAAARTWGVEGLRTAWIHHQGRGFYQSICMADASLLKIFSLPLAQGDPETALKAEWSILLTETMAQKYFGDADPIGKTIVVESETLGGLIRLPGC